MKALELEDERKFGTQMEYNNHCHLIDAWIQRSIHMSNNSITTNTVWIIKVDLCEQMNEK